MSQPSRPVRQIFAARRVVEVELDELKTNLYMNDILIFAKGMPIQCDLSDEYVTLNAEYHT
jgi:glutamate N-acetyltransferase/amino-acid N-acetyltransferase